MTSGERERAKDVANDVMNAINTAADKAVVSCFSLKYAVAVSVYIILKHFLNDIFADLWIAIVLAYAMYSYELIISVLVKKDIINKVVLGEDEVAREKEEGHADEANEE